MLVFLELVVDIDWAWLVLAVFVTDLALLSLPDLRDFASLPCRHIFVAVRAAICTAIFTTSVGRSTWSARTFTEVFPVYSDL